MRARIFVDGKVHVRRSKCDTCIFRPGNLMHLEEGRVENMVEDCGDDGAIPCHKHLDEGVTPVCHGFWSQHRNQVLQLAERLGVVEFTP